ncbi:hypothetical protein [Pantoea vagans]|uniref:hypothetical protein n=1 Tax=Pantoea vagans TaxID=470934 RepID=UPI0028AD2A50|nr:hypothetical protein [Pantoea vagans]
MEKDTGGQAFPLAATEWHGSDEGMTLRDYFAAKAMQAWVGNYDKETAAQWAYDMADAMLLVRGQ